MLLRWEPKYRVVHKVDWMDGSSAQEADHVIGRGLVKEIVEEVEEIEIGEIEITVVIEVDQPEVIMTLVTMIAYDPDHQRLHRFGDLDH